MPSKTLIINADDFGLSSEVNQAVIRAWQEGPLTSASLMVTGDACSEAVCMAKENPGLQTGLHLTLAQGRSVLDHRCFPSLTHPDGSFPHDPVFAGMRMFFLPSLRKQLEAEITAQIERFIATGLHLTHIDGHLNLHMHPTVFAILCRLMPKYGITTFRLSRERYRKEMGINPHRIAGKGLDSLIFQLLAKRCLPELQMRRIAFTDEVKGLLNSGHMTEEYLIRTLDSLSDGLTEIYFHPATVNSSQPGGYQQTAELDALTSTKVLDIIKTKGIILRNYRGEVKNV